MESWLSVLAKEPSLVPSTHIRRIPNCLVQVSVGIHIQMHISTQTYIHIHNLKYFLKIKD